MRMDSTLQAHPYSLAALKYNFSRLILHKIGATRTFVLFLVILLTFLEGMWLQIKHTKNRSCVFEIPLYLEVKRDRNQISKMGNS